MEFNQLNLIQHALPAQVRERTCSTYLSDNEKSLRLLSLWRTKKLPSFFPLSRFSASTRLIAPWYQLQINTKFHNCFNNERNASGNSANVCFSSWSDWSMRSGVVCNYPKMMYKNQIAREIVFLTWTSLGGACLCGDFVFWAFWAILRLSSEKTEHES